MKISKNEMSENELKLIDEYENINEMIIDEIENLKYHLDNTLISDINLINIHYRISELLNKRNIISNKLFNEYNHIIIDEI